MKPTRALSVYLIRDITKFSGMSFKHPDRLTQTEAKQVADWARSVPAVAAAYFDKGHRENGSVRLYADMLEHFLMHHPQTDSAEPAAWPDRSTAERAIPENAFGVTTAEEAEAFLTWAQTVPEYRAAYGDPKHPQHSEYVAQSLELRQLALAPPEAPAPALSTEGNGGLSPARIAELAAQERERNSPRGQIEELRRHPAYLDAKHPEHKAIVAAVTRVYEAASGHEARGAYLDHFASAGEQRAPARSASPARAPGRPLDRIVELRKNPAFLDGKHPDHAATVAAVTDAYREAYPEAAPIAGASGQGNAV